VRVAGRRTGLGMRVEHVLTQPQIELEFYFAERERARDLRALETTIASGTNWGMTGKRPGSE
jgi:hypothetical protein